jgi:glycosyltransferase involved in cell wall biosynthesis
MSVCTSDCPEFLDAALAGLQTQTHTPDELVIVLDGPVHQSIRSALDRWQPLFAFKTRRVELFENRGLGYALKQGLLHCSHEIIARMDSDDINHPNRFEKQWCFLEQNPDIAVVGCWIGCFEKDTNKVKFVRKMPESPEQIARTARHHNPILHPTVMFRKQAVLDTGNYSDLRRNQDYLLWAKMIQAGFRFSAIPEVLYYFRADLSFFNRRKTWNHMRSTLDLQKQFLTMGFISRFEYLRNRIIRIILCFLPMFLSRWIRIKLIKL